MSVLILQPLNSRQELADVEAEADELLEWCAAKVTNEMYERAENFDKTTSQAPGGSANFDADSSSCSSSHRRNVTMGEFLVHDQAEKSSPSTTKHLSHRQFHIPTQMSQSAFCPEPTQDPTGMAASFLTFVATCKSVTTARMDNILADAWHKEGFKRSSNVSATAVESSSSQTTAKSLSAETGEKAEEEDSGIGATAARAVSCPPLRLETQALSPAIASCLQHAPHRLPSVCKRLEGRFLPATIRWPLWSHCVLQVAWEKAQPSHQARFGANGTGSRVQTFSLQKPDAQLSRSRGTRDAQPGLSSAFLESLASGGIVDYPQPDLLLSNAVDDFSALLVEGRKVLGLAADGRRAPNYAALSNALDYVSKAGQTRL